jgi:hypothetical protein
MPPGTKESWHIEKLGKAYEKIDFKHLEIAKKLQAVCENSTLVRYFHASDMSLCAGCHHHSPLEPQKPVPACRTCHDKQTDVATGRADLLGAYHQQCLGCHRQMGGTEKDMPQTCDGCHAKSKQ